MSDPVTRNAQAIAALWQRFEQQGLGMSAREAGDAFPAALPGFLSAIREAETCAPTPHCKESAMRNSEEATIALECLKLAVASEPGDHAQAIELAGKYFAFVIGGTSDAQ